jgi:hypothetical protein
MAATRSWDLVKASRSIYVGVLQFTNFTALNWAYYFASLRLFLYIILRIVKRHVESFINREYFLLFKMILRKDLNPPSFAPEGATMTT